MNRSSKFNFFLPQNTDPIDVSDFNSNFETIDANLLTKAQNLTETQKNAVRANVDLNVANNLTTTAAGSVLDARQGKALSDKFAYADGSYSFSTQAGLNSLIETLAADQEQYKEYKYKLTCSGSFGLFSSGYVYCTEIVRGGSTNYINVEMTPIDDGTIKILGDKKSSTWKWGKIAEYEYGTWTPNIQRATVSDLVGKYKKIGSLYICTFSFSLSAVQTNAPYLNGSSLPGYTSSVFTAAEGSWSSTADEFGAMGNTSNNNIWFSKNNAIYGMSGSVNKTVRGALTYIV